MEIKPCPNVIHKTYGEGEVTEIDYKFNKIYVRFKRAWTNAVMEVGICPEELEFVSTPLQQATPDPSADCLSGWVKAPWEVLMKILDESYQGHQEGCLHCAEINELASHARKHFKPINPEEKGK